MPSNVFWPQCSECAKPLPSICPACAAKQQAAPPLDDMRPAVRNDDPDTSRSAYHALSAKKINERHQEALRLCRQHEGATNSEVARAMGVPRDSISPRMAELRHAGLIIDSGRRRCDAGSKRSQIIWVPVDLAKQGETRE